MTRLKVQRDDVLQELEELGPLPDFDLTTLRATCSAEVWDVTPLPQQRRWLHVAVTKVMSPVLIGVRCRQGTVSGSFLSARRPTRSAMV